VTMKNAVFCDINSVRTSQETLLLRYRANPINAMYDLMFSRHRLGRMLSSGMLRHVALVRTDVSEDFSVSIKPTRIGELAIYLFLQVALDIAVYSASNINKYQKNINNFSGAYIGGRSVKLTNLSPSMSRLPRQ
jgi:hypothetical protein